MTSSAADRRRKTATASFPGAWTLFRVRGVPVRVDISWLVIAGLVVFIFFSRFASLLAAHGDLVVVASAAAAAVLFFASILAHELGHALASLSRGVPVLGITLFLLGGVTESTTEARRARDEFVIVGIGPLISLVLGALFGLAYTVVQTVQPAAVVFGYLAWANVLLAIFNVLPGYPLDGGRLLRSVLWGATGRPHGATRWAARVGQVFAALLIASGVWMFTRSTADWGGIWQILIGLFLYRGAADAHRRARFRERLAARTARDAMGSAPPVLPHDLVLDEAIVRVQERPSLLWPVGEPLRGGLTLALIDRIPSDRWATTTVGDVARDPAAVTVDGSTPMDAVLDRLASAPDGMLLVTDGGRVIGLLTPSLVAGESA